MTIMKYATITSALMAAATGIVAAIYWYRSAVGTIKPTWIIEPVEATESLLGWTTGIMAAFNESAVLNAKAASWTAASVVLAAVSSVLGLWG